MDPMKTSEMKDKIEGELTMMKRGINTREEMDDRKREGEVEVEVEGEGKGDARQTQSGKKGKRHHLSFPLLAHVLAKLQGRRTRTAGWDA
ncbi:hypothetical protein E2C01_075676 [Portunus trituberculatus]|uniref:Uncharacterized protein n=1 Tax=Portunus trituberculatus TaxID=210409 RepID=A0A5B7IGE6_PORTR|nr:hypothetical protein [Portunus trituberculatus]